MIFNGKGGVGKTAIALNLALTCGYGVMTNDPLSVGDQVLPPEKFMLLLTKTLPDFPADWRVIFDFGGYSDALVKDSLQLCDFLLIPVLPYRENLQTALNFLAEITSYKPASEIILIINRTAKGQYKPLKKVFNRFYPDLAVFEIKKSSAFAWMLDKKMSIKSLANKFKLHAKPFGQVAAQFDQIIEYLNQQKG